MAVIRGWLVRTAYENSNGCHDSTSVAMCFVPDLRHERDIRQE